ncbi:hypothetical protein N4562_03255 [Ligilactobacillus agilis]|uniref:Helix-turn-helix type 11 domain-containing protein n=1 Tax=Ligilactobacillus agilis TaxID=1601 RepID=A0A9Q9JAH9_9LACO|nr:hypothetical protein [Ligilactobacillus agilis]UXC64071.1 hypothetical protein N4562_03255 [Ligilactobacillus agilis]UXC66071.1 hypothetical protein N4597_03255 [Ligilactobacillus agilis]
MSNKLTDKQKQILALIPRGINAPIKAKEIAAKTGLDVRTIRENISNLIIYQGFKIGAIRTGREQGYFIATTKQEIEIAVRPLQAQINNMNKRITALKK